MLYVKRTSTTKYWISASYLHARLCFLKMLYVIHIKESFEAVAERKLIEMDLY